MKLPHILGLASMSVLAITLAASTLAQAQSGQASSADKSFVKDAIEGGNAEIELGQLAIENGGSVDVKAFGKRMVDDHTQLGEQMRTVAGQIGVTPPKMIPPIDKALELRLKMLSAGNFDQAYIKAMLKDHRQDLADFQKEASNGNSAAVKDAASQGVPIISSHLKMIQQIAQAHNINAGS